MHPTRRPTPQILCSTSSLSYVTPCTSKECPRPWQAFNLRKRPYIRLSPDHPQMLAKTNPVQTLGGYVVRANKVCYSLTLLPHLLQVTASLTYFLVLPHSIRVSPRRLLHSFIVVYFLPLQSVRRHAAIVILLD